MIPIQQQQPKPLNINAWLSELRKHSVQLYVFTLNDSETTVKHCNTNPVLRKSATRICKAANWDISS